jgi:hypothetical protein
VELTAGFGVVELTAGFGMVSELRASKTAGGATQLDKKVPLIGSSESGPLGALQLPRLWSKVLMSAKGVLDDEYDECGGGFDQMLLDGLGLDREKTLDYLKTSLPTYPEFEQWVLEQKGGSLDQSVIETSNQTIIDYLHPDETVATISEAARTNADRAIKDAVTLNALEDWNEVHKLVTG